MIDTNKPWKPWWRGDIHNKEDSMSLKDRYEKIRLRIKSDIYNVRKDAHETWDGVKKRLDDLFTHGDEEEREKLVTDLQAEHRKLNDTITSLNTTLELRTQRLAEQNSQIIDLNEQVRELEKTNRIWAGITAGALALAAVLAIFLAVNT